MFLIQGHSGVAHPGAGDNAGVRDLDRPAHPLLPAGGQGVHGDEAGGLELFHHRPDELAALDPRGPGDPGGQRGDRAEGGEVLGHGLHQVAGDQEKVRGPGPDGVGGHPAVAQAGHQNRPLFGQGGQGFQHRGHPPRAARRTSSRSRGSWGSSKVR